MNKNRGIKLKLTVKNIGIIENADILLNGITVIAGENATGKSTISKAVFSIFKSLYNYKKIVKEDKLNEVSRLLTNYLFDIEESGTHFSLFRKISEKFSIEISDYDRNKEYSSYEIEKKLKKVLDEFMIETNHKQVDSLISKIEVILNQSEESVLEQLVDNVFRGEFNNQINNIYDSSKGEINLRLGNDNLKFTVIDNVVTFDKKPISIATDVVYIDDAAANVESYYHRRFPIPVNRRNHNDHLKNQLKDRFKNENLTRKAVVNRKLHKIFEIIDSSLGTLQPNDADTSESKQMINIVNYSSGMKTFYIIKTLLDSAVIDEKSTLILDEPEVHLHPEWQLKLANLIVLLQKEFGLHILINTHSPYMLNAIEVFVKKYKVQDNCTFYASNINESKKAIFSEVSNTESIYSVLANPLQVLEDLEAEIDD